MRAAPGGAVGAPTCAPFQNAGKPVGHVGIEAATGVGQGDGAMIAVEKTGVDSELQTARRLAHGRLCESEFCGGLGEGGKAHCG